MPRVLRAEQRSLNKKSKKNTNKKGTPHVAHLRNLEQTVLFALSAKRTTTEVEGTAATPNKTFETTKHGCACRFLPPPPPSLEVLVEQRLTKQCYHRLGDAVWQPVQCVDAAAAATVGSQSELPTKVQVCLEPGRQRQLENPLTQ